MPDVENDGKLRLAAYTRVSSTQQKQDGTIENQKDIIEGYVKFHDNIEIVYIYEDNGVSAFSDRPAFDSMMKNIENYDGIIISKLDRFARSLSQLIRLFDELKEKGKAIIVIGDNIDTTTAQGRLLFHIIGAFNEYEASVIRERLEYGKRRYVEKGGKLGRKKKEPNEPITEKKLKHYYVKAGLGLGKIAKIYDVTKKTIREHLVKFGIEIRKPKGFKM